MGMIMTTLSQPPCPRSTYPGPALRIAPGPCTVDPQGTGRSQYVGPQLGEIAFTFNDTFWFEGSITIGDTGVLYFTSSGNATSSGNDGSRLYAVSPSGETLWKKILDPDGYSENLSTPIISSDGIIYVSSGKGGRIYAIYTDGTEQWTYPAVSTHLTDVLPDLQGNLYFVPYPSRTLISITPGGTLRWELSVPGGFLYYHPGVFSPDGTTLYASGRDSLYAVTTAGEILWGYWTSYWVLNSLVDNDGNIYFYSRGDSCITSLNPYGKVNWRTDISTLDVVWVSDYIAPTMDKDGNVYFSGDGLISLRGIDGSLRWKFAVGSIVTHLVSDAASNLYFGGGSTIYCASSEGELLWQVETPSSVEHLDNGLAISADGICYFPISHNPFLQVVGVK